MYTLPDTIRRYPIDLVSSRHPAFVEYLLEQGIITATTPVLDHVTADDVRGKVVLGQLPTWLSSLCAVYIEVPMRLSPADRQAMTRGDLTLTRTREVADKPRDYVVLSGVHPSALAYYRAIVWAMTTAHDGFVVRNENGRTYVEAGDVGCPVVAEVDNNRPRWRKLGYDLGPWLDAVTGRELPPDPEPSMSEKVVIALRPWFAGSDGRTLGRVEKTTVRLQDKRTVSVEIEGEQARVTATATTIAVKSIGEGLRLRSAEGGDVLGLIVSRPIPAVSWEGPTAQLIDKVREIALMTKDALKL